MKSFEAERSLRVVLAAPDDAGPDSLASMLGTLQGVDLIGRTPSESGALRLCFSLGPDLIVVDSHLVEDEPARLIGLLKRVAPGVRLVALVPASDSMGSAVRSLGSEVVTSAAALVQHVERVRTEHAAGRTAGTTQGSGVR